MLLPKSTSTAEHNNYIKKVGIDPKIILHEFYASQSLDKSVRLQ